jgi:heterodisulfide reductase subunit A
VEIARGKAMPERTGVYVCECGPNIRDAIDLDDLCRFAQGRRTVVHTRKCSILCSDESKRIIASDIQEHGLSRIVIAACSPREHEATFKKVLESAGMNPFLLQIANIREQCAWVVDDKHLATEKAKAITGAAIERVIHHESLESRDMPCNPDALVIGAGVAGLSAALTLAQKKRKVYLVERQPCLGGRVARYEEVFPNLECASCMMDPLLDEVLHNDQIEVLTLAEVEKVLGFFGNFIVNIRKRARYVDETTCIGCGACVESCPETADNEFDENLSERKAIYIPYAGSLPNLAAIDMQHCLRSKQEECSACRDNCPFGSINYDEHDELHGLEVGAIVVATGFDLFDVTGAREYGFGSVDNVYTSLQFERLLSSTGPTGGEIRLKNGGTPGSVALISCVGSRNEKQHEYCSSVCCGYLQKFAHLIKKQIPDAEVTHLFSDLCLPGKGSHEFYMDLCRAGGVHPLRVGRHNTIEVSETGGKISVEYDLPSGERDQSEFEMVVLAPAMEVSRGTESLAALLGIEQGAGGFLVEAHSKLAPVSVPTEGVLIAGCAQGPMNIQSAVAQGEAAAGRALSRLVPGEQLELEAMTAEVNENLCSGCKICVALCPYEAVSIEEETKCSKVNEVLCKGCGVCVASCPTGSMKAKHFTDEQILEEIEAIVNS